MYRVPPSQLHKYTTTLNLLFSRTALRVPRSQPISLTHSMWWGILQLLKAEWNGTIYSSISNTLKWRVLSNVKGKSSKLCLFWLVLYIDRHGSSWGLYRRVLVMGDELILFSVKRKLRRFIFRDPWPEDFMWPVKNLNYSPIFIISALNSTWFWDLLLFVIRDSWFIIYMWSVIRTLGVWHSGCLWEKSTKHVKHGVHM